MITLDTPRWTGTLMRWAEEVELIGVEAGQYGVTLNGRGQRVLVVHQRGEWSWCEHFDGQLGTYKTKELEKDG